jgi:hypothetical protein
MAPASSPSSKGENLHMTDCVCLLTTPWLFTSINSKVKNLHNRSPWLFTSINNSKAQHILANLNHRVGTEYSPINTLVMQNKIDGRHRHPTTRAKHVVGAETDVKWRHRSHPRDVPGGSLSDKSLS